MSTAIMCKNTIVTEDGEEFTTIDSLFVAIPLRGRKISKSGLPQMSIDKDGTLRHDNFTADTLDELIDILEEDGHYRVIEITGEQFTVVLDIEPA